MSNILVNRNWPCYLIHIKNQTVQGRRVFIEIHLLFRKGTHFRLWGSFQFNKLFASKQQINWSQLMEI